MSGINKDNLNYKYNQQLNEVVAFIAEKCVDLGLSNLIIYSSCNWFELWKSAACQGYFALI